MSKHIIFILLFICPLLIYAQSNTNPDISAIGMFNTTTNLSKGGEDYGKIIFNQPNLELFFEGYLNPYSRAVANIAYEEGEFAVEELYASVVRGLPLDIQLKAGKYLVGFGKLNTTHPHAWAFLDRPLFHQVYFGEEGFNDIGINFSFILPTEDFFSSLDIGVFKGDAIGKTEAADPESEESIKELRGNSPVIVARLSSFFDLNDYNNIETGLSASYGVHAKSKYYYDNFLEPEIASGLKNEALNYLYLGFDFKYKYKPDSYSALTVQGEAMLNNRKIVDLFENPGNPALNIKTINTLGAFIYTDYLFSKLFSVGVKYDFTYGIVGDIPSFATLANDDKNKTTGISGWFGYYPVEETIGVRLGIQHLIYNYADREIENDTRATLQMIFSLGPHKAHPF